MSVLRFDKIESEVRTGIRRAAVFLGLGVNAANRSDLKEYQLSQDSILRILPDAPESVVDDWKAAFRIWIIAGGFREVVEHLALFLDRIFFCVAAVPGGKTSASWKTFEKSGLAEKLKILTRDFNISSGFDDALATLTPVRNCLIHRLGVVGKADVAQHPLFLRYHAPRIFVTTPTGDVDIPQEPAKSSPIFFPEGGEAKVQPHMLHEREFKLGETINLSPHELHQILFFSQRCVQQILSSAVNYSISKGAKMHPRSDQDHEITEASQNL